MPRLEKTSAEPRFWAFWAGAALCELPWLAYLLTGSTPLGPAGLLGLRAGSAGLTWLACPTRREAGLLGRPWADVLALCAFLTPGWGPLLAFIVRPARASAGPAPTETLAEELLEADEEDWEEAGSGGELEHRLHAASDVAPAADVLLGRDPSLKRGAIETLARIRTPAAISCLLSARSDRDPEVRFFATSALTALKRDFEQKRRAAEAELFKRPGDFRLELALKRLNLDYAVSGLVDAKSRGAMLAEALRGLDALSRRRPEALLLLFEVQRELSLEGALAALERLIERDGRESLPWIREKTALLFRLGRHAEVRGLLAEHGSEILSTPASPREAPEAAAWKSAVLWWTGD